MNIIIKKISKEKDIQENISKLKKTLIIEYIKSLNYENKDKLKLLKEINKKLN